jgi:hypothetical protein
MARRFYLIGHNPNSVAAAARCLEAGANAIEPDVCFESARDTFYVHEKIPLIPAWILRLFRRRLTLRQYLAGLKAYLARTGRGRQLALIALDLKPPYTYDLNRLAALVEAEFGADFPGTAILVTASDPDAMPWLATLAAGTPRRGVGVDQHATARAVHEFFRTRPLPYTYANGTSLPLVPTTWWLKHIRRAVALDASGPGAGFRLVYAWTVNARRSMRRFLDTEVDGTITDKVARLRGLLRAEYADQYVLATAADDPFPPLTSAPR